MSNHEEDDEADTLSDKDISIEESQSCTEIGSNPPTG